MKEVKDPTCPLCAADEGCPIHPPFLTPEQEQAAKLKSYLGKWRRWSTGSLGVGDVFDGDLFEMVDGRPVPVTPPRLFITGMWDHAVHHLMVYATAMLRRHLRGDKDALPIRDTIEVWTDMEAIERRYGRDNERPERFSSMAKKPGFLVLRLGIQSSKNVELPGIIMETCRLREIDNLPTAVVNEPFTPWGRNHLAHSPEIDRYFDARFHRVTCS